MTQAERLQCIEDAREEIEEAEQAVRDLEDGLEELYDACTHEGPDGKSTLQLNRGGPKDHGYCETCERLIPKEGYGGGFHPLDPSSNTTA